MKYITTEVTGIARLCATSLRLHEYQEIINPLFVPKSFRFKESKTRHPRYNKPRTQIPQEKWQEVVSRKDAGESLRQLAGSYGVSYEAIRQVVKRVTEAS